MKWYEWTFCGLALSNTVYGIYANFTIGHMILNILFWLVVWALTRALGEIPKRLKKETK